jgi:hypothetical protein
MGQPIEQPVQFVLRVTESTLTACVTQNGLANTPCVDWTGAPTGPTSLAINADIKAPSGSGGLGSVFFQVVTYPSPYESVPWTITVTGPGVTCGAYPGDPPSQACH